MILMNADFSEFAETVRKENRQIVFFGAGAILAGWMPYVCKEYQLDGFIAFCVDNDSNKWDKAVSINGNEIVIRPFEALIHAHSERIVVLITTGYYASILEQLDSVPQLSKVPCYVASVMHITHKKRLADKVNVRLERTQCIPKIIHYCWFGGTPLPEKALKCIETWKRYCPDYEIICWDERNYDISKSKYMTQAYQAKKWGYVPDYARLDLLYRFGGLYFDTDVELIRNPDDLLFQKGFCSLEDWPVINMGGGSGSVKGHPMIKQILDKREDVDFIRPDGTYNLTTSGQYETPPLVEKGLRLDGTMQAVEEFTVLPSEFFHPISTITGEIQCTSNTFGIHHFNWSWASSSRSIERQATLMQYSEIFARLDTDRE